MRRRVLQRRIGRGIDTEHPGGAEPLSAVPIACSAQVSAILRTVVNVTGDLAACVLPGPRTDVARQPPERAP